MLKNRLAYVFALVCALMFYVAYPRWFAWYLLVVTALLLPFDLVMSLPGMLVRRVSFSAPRVLEQGEKGTLIVTTKSDKNFPAGRVKGRLCVTGDAGAVKRRIVLGGAPGSRYHMELDTSRGSVTVFALQRIWVCSVLGLFSIPISVGCSAAVVVLPAPVRPPNSAALPRSMALRPKPGGGFAEEHDIRPYRLGDPANSVHWKLSAKHDSLIIREPLVPPPHSRLIRCASWSSPRERDLILGRLRWISDHLLERDCPHYVQLGGRAIAEVTKPSDLAEYLYRSQTGGTLPPANLPARFTWVFGIDAKEETP